MFTRSLFRGIGGHSIGVNAELLVLDQVNWERLRYEFVQFLKIKRRRWKRYHPGGFRKWRN